MGVKEDDARRRVVPAHEPDQFRRLEREMGAADVLEHDAADGQRGEQLQHEDEELRVLVPGVEDVGEAQVDAPPATRRVLCRQVPAQERHGVLDDTEQSVRGSSLVLQQARAGLQVHHHVRNLAPQRPLDAVVHAERCAGRAAVRHARGGDGREHAVHVPFPFHEPLEELRVDVTEIEETEQRQLVEAEFPGEPVELDAVFERMPAGRGQASFQGRQVEDTGHDAPQARHPGVDAPVHAGDGVPVSLAELDLP